MRCSLEIKKLSDIYDKSSNSFDDIRFIFACLVLYVHSYALLYGESGGTDPFTIITHFQLSPGTLAVYGFFVLSGFFMIQSLESNPLLWQYAKNRILRIVPAFWLSLLLSSFVLVPLIAKDALIISLDPGSSLYFFLKSAVFQFFGAAWTINGAFPSNPLIDNINGSIWTLKYEVFLYLMLPIVSFLVYRKRQFILYGTTILMILAVAFITGNFVLFSAPNIDEYSKLLILTSFFYYGVLLYLYRDVIIVSKRFIIIFGAIFVLSLFLGNLKLITLFVFPYLIIAFGSIIHTRWFSKTGDYSYGMYIYAFPVQQMLVHFFQKDLNAATLFLSSFIVTLFLSILSWHLFEKKILSMKHKRKNLHV